MYDSNVFAVLFPYDENNKATTAFALPQNGTWFHSATGGVAQEPTIDSREPTPAPDASSGHQEYATTDRLVVTFDGLLKGSKTCQNGMQFGTNKDICHILLGHRGTRGISARQYNIIVDQNLWIWLRDYHSTHGTAVAHNGQNQREVLKKDEWLLAYEPASRRRLKNITVHTSGLVLKIEFPNHEAANPQYIANLRAFVKLCGQALPYLNALDLHSEAATATPSQIQSPSGRLVYFHDKKLGRGAFGRVNRLIRLRDGKYFAAKHFSRPSKKRKHDDEDLRWLAKIRDEFNVMRDNPHPNIMRVIEFRDGPQPFFIMDYYKHGKIEKTKIAYDKYVTIFGQVMDGLSHLHAKGIAHRDLKPENILVEKHPFFKVVITDFGLSKIVQDDAVMRTFCGTLKYLAPEAFPGMSRGYDFSIDVWASGVIFFEWLYDAPQPPLAPDVEETDDQWYDWIYTWAGLLRQKLKNEDDDAATEIFLRMIEVNPKKRWPADRCLQRGFANGLFERRVGDRLVVGAHDLDEVEDDSLSPPSSPETLQSAEGYVDSEASTIVKNVDEATDVGVVTHGQPPSHIWSSIEDLVSSPEDSISEACTLQELVRIHVGNGMIGSNRYNDKRPSFTDLLSLDVEKRSEASPKLGIRETTITGDKSSDCADGQRRGRVEDPDRLCPAPAEHFSIGTLYGDIATQLPIDDLGVMIQEPPKDTVDGTRAYARTPVNETEFGSDYVESASTCETISCSTNIETITARAPALLDIPKCWHCLRQGWPCNNALWVPCSNCTHNGLSKEDCAGRMPPHVVLQDCAARRPSQVVLRSCANCAYHGWPCDNFSNQPCSNCRVNRLTKSDCESGIIDAPDEQKQALCA